MLHLLCKNVTEQQLYNDKKNILSVILARGGSKGIPKKILLI